MEARSYQTCTPEAYLEAEKVSEVLHEFLAGTVHPPLLFEVLSPPTDQIDRREKLLAYQTIPSLDHYLIVSQDERRVEWIRRDGATWTATVLEEPDDQLSFPKLGMELKLAEIYEGIQFGESIQPSV